MNADQIRKELQGLAQVRAGLEADLEKCREEIDALLKAARDSGEISVTEAAELANLSRLSVYNSLSR